MLYKHVGAGISNAVRSFWFGLTASRIGAVPVMALRAHRHSEVRHFLKASGATVE